MKKQAQLYTFHMEFAVTLLLLMQPPNPISSYKDLSPEVILLDTNI